MTGTKTGSMTAETGTPAPDAGPAARGDLQLSQDQDQESPSGPGGGVFARRLPWVLAGVGVASLGAGALLTSWGRRDNDQLSICSPQCNPNDVRHIRRLYVGADVAFGVGIAALAAGYWLYAVGHDGSTAEASGETALRLDLSPTRAGGVASVSGRF
jgi:hypothetical protein